MIESYASEDAAAGIPGEDRVLRLFGENAFGLTAVEISQIYRKKYREAAAAAKPWWERVPRWVPWLVAVLALFLGPLKAWFEEKLKRAYENSTLR